MYGLKKSPSNGYYPFETYLLKNGYKRGVIENTLSIKQSSPDIILAQVYLDDIIFGLMNESPSQEFGNIMS